MDYPVRCAFCDEPLRPDQVGIFRQVTCWLENRGRAGGSNMAVKPSAPVAWSHPACLKYAPVSDDQIALF